MHNKYASFRNFVSRYKNNPDFKIMTASFIYRWAKDETLELGEFAFLVKKALGYVNKQNCDKSRSFVKE